MAIYPYRCDQCGREWEVVQSPLLDAKSACEICGLPAKRVWTNFKVYRWSSFVEGYDYGLGKWFRTDRERQKYLDTERPQYTKLTGRNKGVKVG